MSTKDFLDKINYIENKYEELMQRLSEHKNIGDKEYIKLNKEISDLSESIGLIKEYKSILHETSQINLMINDEKNLSDEEFLKELVYEKELLEKGTVKLENQIKEALLPKEKEDSKNAILEVRAGTGGAEATLFARELFGMYQKYASNRKWSFEILSLKETECNGFREAIALIHGKDVFAALKFESGVHRVQRVPSTESSGRVHTSAATVAILPEAEQTDVILEDKDLIIETCRSSGAGGQHVNTTDSMVKITHIPTGITVTQQSKSQHRNKANAINILRARILDQEVQAQRQERDSNRKSQIGSGDRSEKIRTYNFPQNRITDHRINLTTHNVDKVIFEGNLDLLIEALQNENKNRLLTKDA